MKNPDKHSIPLDEQPNGRSGARLTEFLTESSTEPSFEDLFGAFPEEWDEEPISEEERIEAAAFAQALGALESGRRGLSVLPSIPSGPDDLASLVSLSHLLRAEAGELSASRQDLLWADLEERTLRLPISKPEKSPRLSWWRFFSLGIPSFAILMFVVWFSSTPPQESTLDAATIQALLNAQEGLTGPPPSPGALAALEDRRAEHLPKLQQRGTTQPAGDTALRDYRRARLAAIRADLDWERHFGASTSRGGR